MAAFVFVVKPARGQVPTDSNDLTTMRDRGRPVAWSWSIDYARFTMDGKHFWLPKTISSKSSSLDGGRFKWSFLATHGNYHLMTVTSTILPAANSVQH